MKISVIIPIYNAEQYLENCVNSVINQTYENIEIILVNDGSSDRSEQICRALKEKDNRIVVFSKKNGGVSSARNLGISRSKGDYIFFLDSDDSIDVDTINCLVKYYTKDTLNSILVKKVFHSKNIIEKYPKEIYSKEDFQLNLIRGKIGGYSWGYLFDASIVKNMTFDQNTTYMEDMIFMFEYLEKANIKRIRYIDEGTYYNYLYNTNSATTNKNILKKMENAYYSIDKINELTHSTYLRELSDKKIRILESELRLISKREELKRVFNEIKINYYSGERFRFKIFSILYVHKSIIGLKTYYKIRKITKDIVKKHE